jgi:hypothetical protein
MWERDLNMLACGLSLNPTSEGVMFKWGSNLTGYPLNPIPVGRLKLGLQLNVGSG